MDNPFYYIILNTILLKLTYFLYFFVLDIRIFLELHLMENKLIKEDRSQSHIKEIHDRKTQTKIYKHVYMIKNCILDLDPSFIYFVYFLVLFIEFFVLCIFSRSLYIYTDPFLHQNQEFGIRSEHLVTNNTKRTLVVIISPLESGGEIIKRWLYKGQPSYPHELFTVVSFKDPLQILCPQNISFNKAMYIEGKHILNESWDKIVMFLMIREPIELISFLIKKEQTAHIKYASNFNDLVKNVFQKSHSLSLFQHFKHMFAFQIHEIRMCDEQTTSVFRCYTQKVCKYMQSNTSHLSATHHYALYVGMHDHILENW